MTDGIQIQPGFGLARPTESGSRIQLDFATIWLHFYLFFVGFAWNQQLGISERERTSSLNVSCD